MADSGEQLSVCVPPPRTMIPGLFLADLHTSVYLLSPVRIPQFVTSSVPGPGELSASKLCLLTAQGSEAGIQPSPHPI